MSEITVGELLLEGMKAEGIEAMFGIVDGSHIPFVARTPQYNIRYVNAHHEEAAVHLAEGYTRISGKISVVIGNPGPGGANMLAGVTSAYGEGYPLLAIACTRRSATTQPDRGGAWQATDLYEMAKPITKYSGLVTRWDRLPEMMRAAFRAATTGRPGPAFLAIPDEMIAMRVDAGKVRVIPAEQYRVKNMGAGDPASIELAAKWLSEAKKPYIHAGKGVEWAGAAAELLSLGNYLAAGMGSSLGASGVVPQDHPHYFHQFDMPAIAVARKEADVVLIVGSRLGEYDGWGLPPAWGEPAAQKTIHIDADPFSIGLNRPVDLGIVADSKCALQAILNAVKTKTAPRTQMPDLEKYREMSAKTIEQAVGYLGVKGKKGINPAQMVTAVRQFFARDAITVLDGGNIVLSSVAFNPIFTSNSFIYSVKMGYLGTGLPYAIGAKLAAPDRQTYLISGDGALGFNIMEMETALRENAPVIVIVAVDKGWGMERSAFKSRGFNQGQYVGIDLSPAIRYDIIAQGMGCFGEKVDDITQLPEVLKRAVESGKPALIHVCIDADLNVDPPGRELFKYLRSL